jgi:hypothetical protein
MLHIRNLKFISISSGLEICAEFNLLNPKIYFFLLVLAAVAPLSVNIIASASTTSATISSASCHPSRNPLFRKKQVTPVIFLSEGDGIPTENKIPSQTNKKNTYPVPYYHTNTVYMLHPVLAKHPV